MCLNSPSHGLALKSVSANLFRKAAAKLLILFGICKFLEENIKNNAFILKK